MTSCVKTPASSRKSWSAPRAATASSMEVGMEGIRFLGRQLVDVGVGGLAWIDAIAYGNYKEWLMA